MVHKQDTPASLVGSLQLFLKTLSPLVFSSVHMYDQSPCTRLPTSEMFGEDLAVELRITHPPVPRLVKPGKGEAQAGD